MRGVRTLVRLLRWLIISFLLVLLAVPAALFAVLATETGSGWLLSRADRLVAPLGMELKIGGSRGNLLGRLELDDVLFDGAGTMVELGHLVFQWQPRALLERTLHIEALELADMRVVPPAPTESETTAPEIPDLVLPIALRLDRFLLERLEIEQEGGNVLVNRLSLGAAFDRQGLAIRDLQFDGEGAQIEGVMSMQATAPHALTGEISARIDQAVTGDDVGPVAANAVLEGAALAPAFDVRLSAPTDLRLQGTLKLDQVEPAFDIVADWPVLQWPLQGNATVTSRDGQLTLKGLASDYRLELRTGLDGEGMPPGKIDLVALGDLQGIRLQPLKVDVLDGRLQADGSLHWDGDVRWDLELLADRINPGLYEPELPGRLSGRIDVSGSLADESAGGLAVRLRIKELGGQLREYEVGASGELDYRRGELHARALQLTSGPNRIFLDGRADERLDLKFEIKAPDLVSLYPGLSGRLEGNGRLEGTPQAPVVVATLNGQAVGYEQTVAQELRLDLDWRETGGKGRLSLKGLQAGDVRVSEMNADLDGTPESHQLKFAAESTEFNVGLTAQGGLKEQTWEGQLQRLNLLGSGLGEWQLRAPAKLRLGASEASSGPLCLTQAATSLCTEGGWKAAGGLNLSANLVGLDLAQLGPYLPGEAAIEGSLGASVKVSGDTASPDVVFELRPSDGVIRVEQDLQPLELAYRNAKISGRFAQDAGSADLNFELGPRGRARGRLLLGADKGGQRAIGGEIDVDFPDLGLVSGFVPALAQVKGRLGLSTELAGTLDAPRVKGVLEIADASAQVPEAGIELTDVALAVRGDGGAPLRVQGQLSSGGGKLDIAGTVDMAAAAGPTVDLTLKGSDFQAVRLPEALVLVSPDLRLEGGGPYHLSGKLLIPKAAIEIEEVPSGTVSVSDDEIIVGEETTQSAPTGSQNLTARVRVELGKDVTFKGFGLKTALDGVLDAKVDAQGTRVDGKIELRDGEYKAYGQELKIERGRLLFVGPPGNPGVDLRAVRESLDGRVKAYLAMSGPLSKPRPRIFSEPSLPEAEALAYLLTGRGLDEAGQQDGSNIAGAALSLGISKAEPLMQQLSERFGLDDVRVEGGEKGLEDTSVILGKYLNPDLYVGYSQGLFNPEGAVLLRLRLSERLEVESRSGNEQSVDLFYRLQHD
ncbi:MAG: translocation/assembly module TamB domain-containing protein [Sedimenticolaceae bacterium]